MHPRVFATITDGDVTLLSNATEMFNQKNPFSLPMKKPLLFKWAEDADRESGTDCRRRVAEMIYEVGLQAACADGPLCSAAESELVSLRRLFETEK